MAAGGETSSRTVERADTLTMREQAAMASEASFLLSQLVDNFINTLKTDMHVPASHTRQTKFGGRNADIHKHSCQRRILKKRAVFWSQRCHSYTFMPASHNLVVRRSRTFNERTDARKGLQVQILPLAFIAKDLNILPNAFVGPFDHYVIRKESCRWRSEAEPRQTSRLLHALCTAR